MENYLFHPIPNLHVKWRSQAGYVPGIHKVCFKKQASGPKPSLHESRSRDSKRLVQGHTASARTRDRAVSKSKALFLPSYQPPSILYLLTYLLTYSLPPSSHSWETCFCRHRQVSGMRLQEIRHGPTSCQSIYNGHYQKFLLGVLSLSWRTLTFFKREMPNTYLWWPFQSIS